MVRVQAEDISVYTHERRTLSFAALTAKETPMKKTAPKKMTLTRETLGTLSDSDVKAILGGAISDQCTTSRFVCCPDM
jgi:hypothetical protein